MKERQIGDGLASHFIVRANRDGALPGRLMESAATHWFKPLYEDFEPRTLWSAYNAVTSALKRSAWMELPARTGRLNVLVDQVLAAGA
jgi:hypothetical protein